MLIPSFVTFYTAATSKRFLFHIAEGAPVRCVSPIIAQPGRGVSIAVACVIDTVVPCLPLTNSTLASSSLASAWTMLVPKPASRRQRLLRLAHAVVRNRQLPVRAVGVVGDDDPPVGLALTGRRA